MSVRIGRALRLTAAASTVALSLAACGGGDATTGSDATTDSSDSASGSDTGATVDLEAAGEFLEPFQQPPAEFPMTEPLETAPPPDTEVVFLQAATSTSAKQNASLKAAADAMGWEYSAIEVGGTSDSINSAVNSVVEMKPDVVLNVSIDPVMFTSQLEALREAGVKVISGGIVNGGDFGFETVMAATDDVVQTGKIMAAQALVDGGGDVTRLVYYKTPELAFTSEMQRGVEEGVEEFCDGCELRIVDIPITDVGSTSQNTIVSDLQANPETQAATASFAEIYLGLTAALDVAGIDIYTISQAPVESTFEEIQAGDQDASVAWDLDMMMWSMMDQAARELIGQELTPYQQEELLTKVVITEENLPEDFSEGFGAFPDDREKFAELWTS